MRTRYTGAAPCGMVSPMIRPIPLVVWLCLAAAALPAGAAAQGYTAPKPGTVLQFTVARGTSAAAGERLAITILAAHGDVVTADTAAGRTQYVAKLARGIFTFEIAEAAIVFRHDYQPAALAKLWPLQPGKSAVLSGRLLAAPAKEFKPSGAFQRNAPDRGLPLKPIGAYEARFAVRERVTVITSAGPFEVFAIARDIQRRDAQGKPLQRETGEIWFAPQLGWQVRSDMRTDGPKGGTSRIELVDVAGQ